MQSLYLVILEFMNVRKAPTIGVGSAHPNTSTIVSVGAFGQATPGSIKT